MDAANAAVAHGTHAKKHLFMIIHNKYPHASVYVLV